MSTRPKHKLKHRPPRIERLLKYDRMPPPLTGDPPERGWRSWEERCIAVYRWMISQKKGEHPQIPPRERRGLWFHAT